MSSLKTKKDIYVLDEKQDAFTNSIQGQSTFVYSEVENKHLDSHSQSLDFEVHDYDQTDALHSSKRLKSDLCSSIQIQRHRNIH